MRGSGPFFVGGCWHRDSLPEPRPVFVWVRLLQRTEEGDQLLDVIQVGSECQEFCFTSDLAWMFGIEGNASQILPNAQTHQVIASKLLAGQALPGFIILLPGPGEILVGNALVAEVAVGLASGQDVPDEFQ